MSIGFILGNGISRRDIPFSNLKLKGMIYGCNAIYREYTPDVLVATDPGIGEYIQNSGYSKKHRFFCFRVKVDVFHFNIVLETRNVSI
jgi:hypothetical protein